MNAMLRTVALSLFVLGSAFAVSSVFSSSAYAQAAVGQGLETGDPESSSESSSIVEDEIVLEPAPEEGTPEKEEPPQEVVFNRDEYPSILFTYWEHAAIDDARRSRGLVRKPSEAELTRDLKTREELKLKPPPEERDISLGGIVYRSVEDWTIWLNGKRVTPDALPEEALDLRVFNDYIEIKWFDEYSNQIFPIRLRPHQRFNIDARIFLPG